MKNRSSKSSPACLLSSFRAAEASALAAAVDGDWRKSGDQNACTIMAAATVSAAVHAPWRQPACWPTKCTERAERVQMRGSRNCPACHPSSCTAGAAAAAGAAWVAAAIGGGWRKAGIQLSCKIRGTALLSAAVHAPWCQPTRLPNPHTAGASRGQKRCS